MDTLNITRNIYDDANEEKLVFKSDWALCGSLVRQISADKEEPEWMLKKRLDALELFENMDMPNFVKTCLI